MEHHYLLNFDKLMIVNRFTTAMDADKIGQKSNFGYLVLSSVESLKQLTIKHLKALQKNLGATGAVDNKTEACPRIWDFIVGMELEVATLPAPKDPKAKGKGRKHQGIGDFIMVNLAKGQYSGMSNKAIAGIANEQFEGAKVSSKSVSWYKWKLNKSHKK